jgi:hypothetical protein
MNDECDMCYEYKRCTGDKCTKHTLLDGSIKDFAEAMYEGRLWGDIIYEEEKEMIANESEEEKKKRLAKKGAEEQKSLDNLKESILNKNKFKNCVKIDGKYVLKHKYSSPCENLKLKDEVLSDGSKYPGGCWAHKENLCPFMHPDEKGKYEFKRGSRLVLVNDKTAKTRGGRRHKKRRTYKK